MGLVVGSYFAATQESRVKPKLKACVQEARSSVNGPLYWVVQFLEAEFLSPMDHSTFQSAWWSVRQRPFACVDA